MDANKQTDPSADSPHLLRVFESERVVLDVDARAPLKSHMSSRDTGLAAGAVDFRPAADLAAYADSIINRLLAGDRVSLRHVQSAEHKVTSDLEEQSLGIYGSARTSTPFGQAALAVVLASRPDLLLDRDKLPPGWLTQNARQVLIEYGPDNTSQVHLRQGNDVIGHCAIRCYATSLLLNGTMFGQEWRWLLPSEQRHFGHVTYIRGLDGTLRFADVNTFLAQCAAEELLQNESSGIAEQWLQEALSFPHTRPAINKVIEREGREQVRGMLISHYVERAFIEPDPARILPRAIDALLRDADKGLPHRKSHVSMDRLNEEHAAEVTRVPDLPDVNVGPVLELLSPKQRELVWRLNSGETQAGIAQRLGVSQPAVSQQLATIRRKLRAPTRPL